tara:strand:+ start:66 stop:689 length:624 start_codon:yes stop_codon:yes gene_type:complete
MGWFDILKISFKPVDRDRPAPKIKLTESLSGEVGSYNPETGETNISPNPNITPEELADTLAHESTHEAQFATAPILREIIKEAQHSIVALIFAVRATPLEDLTTEVISELLGDVELGIGNAVKRYLEQELSIEIQAYSLERNFETREDRRRFVHLLLDSFEARILGSLGAVEVGVEKERILMSALMSSLEPIFIRIFETFVRREGIN